MWSFCVIAYTDNGWKNIALLILDPGHAADHSESHFQVDVIHVVFLFSRSPQLLLRMVIKCGFN